ncbi:FHA domain-containing protein [Cystobacter fuscus]|uniref:FHA domain-containing protein n=1 Tax=Cystobacter fuscus TaxID=43 RepID=UPI0037C1A44F
MSNGSPPTRRRPTTSSSSDAPSGGAARPRPTARRSPTAAAAPRASEPEPLPPSATKLVCTAGPCAGQEFGLEEGEYVIGRANDNPICIPDSSVSRRHVLIRRLGGGWTVNDLGSGNGTLMNGEPLSEETPLVSGAVLTLGDTELTFNDASNATMMMPMPSAPPARPARSRTAAAPAAPAAQEEEGDGEAAIAPRRPPPRPESRARPARGRAAAVDPEAQKRKKRLLVISASVFVLLAGVLLVMKLQQQRQAEAQRQSAQAALQQREQIAGLFQEAKNLIRDGKWTDAKARLLELKEAEPDHPQVGDYLARVEKEIPNQLALEAARTALEQNQLGPASTSLAQVTQDTQMFEAVGSLRRGLKDKADKRVGEALSLLTQKQLDQAKAITDDVLVAFPEHRDAKVVNEQAARAIAERDAPPPPPTPKAVPKPWDQAVDRYRDGDLQGAMAMANDCASKAPQCKTLTSQLADFGMLYKRMEDLDDRGLTRLLDLDRKITNGRGSKLVAGAGKRAANNYYKMASSAKVSGQWGRAMDYAQRALQADPGNTGAANIVSEMRQKAKDVYMSAYAMKDTDPEEALPKFREVMTMTSPDDETHQKAKGWVEKLKR